MTRREFLLILGTVVVGAGIASFILSVLFSQIGGMP
jgi:hypothetical protein